MDARERKDSDGEAPPFDVPERGRGWRVLGWLSIVMSVVLVTGSLSAYAFWRRLDGRIERENVDGRLGDHRPDKLNNSVNILLLGSDSRAGKNSKYGSTEGRRSDTAILLHLSPGGERAIGITFPRDSMVRIPGCTTEDGRKVPARLGMINSAYALGGPACTWKTIESISDIRIDHYVEVDFSGFTKVVDALGGVEICVPKAINDPKAELRLKKGRQVVGGQQALGFVRTRSSALGDGSDLSRIKRQQAFMASVVRKATDRGLLTDPGRLYDFLSAVAGSIKTDDRLTLTVMRDLASSVRGMSAGEVRFVTVPVQAYRPDPNRVQINPSLAAPLFDAVRQDNTVPEPAPKPKPGKGGQGPKRKPVKPARVKVEVYNATDISGLAGRVADQLKEKGFKVVKVGNRDASGAPETRILYGKGAKDEAAALAVAVPGHRPESASGARRGRVVLVVGKGGARIAGTARAAPKINGEIRADQDICRGT